MEALLLMWTHVTSSARSCYYQARGATLSLLLSDGSHQLDNCDEVWILGTQYPAGEAARDILATLGAIPWFTYRKHFEVIPTSRYTCDSGWGCMVRTGQMLLASTLLLHHLGRRLRSDPEGEESSIYTEVMSWFCDTPDAPYSIHNICLAGQDFGDVKVGHWFTPSLISNVLQRLVNNCQETSSSGRLMVYLGQHTTVYKAEVEEMCSLTHDESPHDLKVAEGADQAQPPPPAANSADWVAVLILIPVLLGMREVNDVYHPLLLRCCQFPQFVGIIGGRPRYSLYFFGTCGGDLLYRDPHADVQAALTSLDDAPGRLHSAAVHTLRLRRLDPSMALGFYCRTRAEFEDFVARARHLAERTPTPIFAVEEAPQPNRFDADDGQEIGEMATKVVGDAADWTAASGT